MGFDLEGDGPVVADGDDASVFADTGEKVLAHLVGHGFTEVAQVYLGGLVGAVLGPHDGVHGEFCVGGATAEDFADAQVLVFFEAEFLPGLFQVGGDCRVGNGIKLLFRHLSSILSGGDARPKGRRRGRT